MYPFDRTQLMKSGRLSVPLLGAVLLLLGGGTGFLLGLQVHSADPLHPLAQQSAPFASSPTSSRISQQEFDSLVARLGEMQAQVQRLNAFGERLASMAGIDPEEFDFSHVPSQGGPDDGAARDFTIKELVSELGSVSTLLQDQSSRLTSLETVVATGGLTGDSVPASWPVRTGYISSPFGYRVHPTKKVRLFHSGVDFACPRGSSILAVGGGVVTFSGVRRGYGRVVEVRLENGLVTRYAHNQSNLVRVGDRVRRGQKIALVGSSGVATGPHVHFEVLINDRPINPMQFLAPTPTRTLAGVDPDPAG